MSEVSDLWPRPAAHGQPAQSGFKFTFMLCLRRKLGHLYVSPAPELVVMEGLRAWPLEPVTMHLRSQVTVRLLVPSAEELVTVQRARAGGKGLVPAGCRWLPVSGPACLYLPGLFPSVPANPDQPRLWLLPALLPYPQRMVIALSASREVSGKQT